MERKCQKVLGYSVDLLSFEKAIAFVKYNIDSCVGMHIVTINPEMIEIASKNEEFSKILMNADLVVPDGAGIELALRLRGIKQERIAGIDFAKELIKSCTLMNYSIAMIGAKEEVIQETVKKLKLEIPDLNISFFRNGYFSSDEHDEIISNLTVAQPKLVLVALGTPRQEFFINKCREILPNSVFIGVGGSFDVWAGSVERAPKIFQFLRLEWLYRTIKQPERFKRICKTLPSFVIKAIIDLKN